MKTIQYLLSKIFVIIIFIFIFGVLYWIGTLFIPYLPKTISKANIVKETGTEFFLPTPMNLAKLLKAPTVTNDTAVNYDLYTADNSGQKVDEQFYQNSLKTSSIYGTNNTNNTSSQYGQVVYTNLKYLSYDPTGKNIYNTTNDTPKNVGLVEMGTYIRGVTLFNGGYVHKGLTFHGQARKNMFTGGKFSLYIIDGNGNFLAKGGAISDGEWQNTGWHNFTAFITTTVPYSTNCFLVFQQDVANGLHTIMPVACR